ncbi:MAG TPA: hypothetical protein VFQ61_07950 [Polyangiaceae bacterium]|nr:hypothetical protein [Polyangiaceae bacterium]
MSPQTRITFGASFIKLSEVTPGDIIQFRDYSMEKTTVVSVLYPPLPGGAKLDENPVEESVNTESVSEPHHTAIAKSLYSKMRLTVLHQNFGDAGMVVQSTSLALASIPASKSTTVGTRTLEIGGKQVKLAVKITTTVTVDVSGTIWAYRPIKK